MTRTFDIGGTIVVTAEVSGQTVIASNSGQTINIGNVPTVIGQVSGQTVVGQISGQRVAFVQGSGFNPVYLTNADGTIATTVQQPGGDNTNFFVASQAAVNTINILYAYDQASTRSHRVRLTASGSPLSQSSNQTRLLVDSTRAGDAIQTSPLVQLTDTSGGVQLGSVRTIHGIIIKNLSGNTPVYIGGIGTNAPFSGKGFILMANEVTPKLNIQSASGVRVFATTSGQFISWMGIDF